MAGRSLRPGEKLRQAVLSGGQGGLPSLQRGHSLQTCRWLLTAAARPGAKSRGLSPLSCSYYNAVPFVVLGAN